jgi:hypothetical protein
MPGVLSSSKKENVADDVPIPFGDLSEGRILLRKKISLPGDQSSRHHGQRETGKDGYGSNEEKHAADSQAS